ncbi:6-phospho-3-hexuloisomerase [Alkalicoccobacillus plakortidis]|uniref:6-phospho-3-hexuloisomerase n=1 Tax=Alkalicoccobacillus plakortidis TaxID=444060 RepID=A0ABT0XJF9_9BACI|nr:6-phospho-3-hexuloisomerase [Alkalicoccobacillus plakortidis]MCM2676040.1 6-phospho-3-hexuloisomerase [Alkalicoccobacillus plakortidis]
MNTTEYLETIIQELQGTVQAISESEADQLVEAILKAKKVFVTGAGRSGLMGKSFVMRMMHMGIDAYAVGETVTANLEQGDLLIVGTGSGETKTLIPIVEKAKSLGGVVAAITLSPQSTIGEIADFTVILPGAPKDREEGQYETIQPMGSLFEQTSLLFYDAVILRFMEKKGLDSKQMYGKHANLE